MSIRNDFRTAARRIAGSPGITLVILATLALGIGANTAVFSVIRAVVLTPLPYPDSDRIVGVYAMAEGEDWTTSPPDFVDWRRMARSFEGMAAYWRESGALSGMGDAEQMQTARVTGDFFRVLATPPTVGREFTPAELQPGGANVAIVSHGFWMRKLAGAPGALGSAVRLDGEPVTIVGITPPGFSFPKDVEIWRPASFTAEDLETQRGARYLGVIARLAAGVSIERSTAEMQGIVRALAKEYPRNNEDLTDARTVTLLEKSTSEVRPALTMLMASVALVLLIACANVANVLLARSVARRREIAIRSSLGATRWRLVRQLLVESVLLAISAGAIGVMLASWLVTIAKGLEIAGMPRLDQIRIDGTVLAFSFAASLATAILFGTFPALLLGGRRNPGANIRDNETRTGEGVSGRKLRSALVISEIALSLLLVSGAGLLIKSFSGLVRTDPGFDPRNVTTFQLTLPESRYDDARISGFVGEMVERLGSTPGVESAAAVFGLPMSGFSYTISIADIDGAKPEGALEDASLGVRIITPGYPDAMRIPIVRGRGLLASDIAGTPDAVLLNESAARLLFGDRNPIGHSVRLGTRFGREERAGGTVAGILGDIRHRELGSEPAPEIYLAHAQFPSDFVAFVVRSPLPAEALIPAVRGIVRAIDPEIPIFKAETMESWVSGTVAVPRMTSVLLAGFAGLAVLLVAVGIFAVMAYAVSQRTREIGVRMALGANSSAILGGVTRDAARLAVAGIAIGLLGSWLLPRVLSTLLVGVSAADPLVWLGAAALLLIVALVASWVPARRASRVDPVTALRAE